MTSHQKIITKTKSCKLVNAVMDCVYFGTTTETEVTPTEIATYIKNHLPEELYKGAYKATQLKSWSSMTASKIFITLMGWELDEWSKNN